jgi:hypothetical protein
MLLVCDETHATAPDEGGERRIRRLVEGVGTQSI